MLWPWVLLILAVKTTHSSSPEAAVFTPGTLPLDTSGKQVHAHGGGMFQQNGTFFWYGTTQKYAPAWISEGINLYSSRDLQAWQLEGRIFSDEQITGTEFSHPYRIERPKILYSEAMQEYTMLFHLDTPNFALTSVGIAKAGSIRGPWRWVKALKPDGLSSFDMTAWQDTDGSAYLARSIDNSYLGISRLTDDFTETEGVCATGPQAEAPAFFKPGEGEFIILASHLTGWSANPPQQFAIKGETPCSGSVNTQAEPAVGPGSETTFNSQPAYIFPLRFESGEELFVYMGDRWNFNGPGSVGAASYVWLPLIPNKDEHGYEIKFFPEWSPRQVLELLRGPSAQSRTSLVKLLVQSAADFWHWCKELHQRKLRGGRSSLRSYSDDIL